MSVDAADVADDAAAVALLPAAVALLAAAVADDAAAVALLPDVVADDALAVALLAAAVADDAAAVWLVVALAASTISAHFAASVLVVKGCDPDDVCAVTQMKMLPVLVSFTRSLTAYAVDAPQLPRYVPSSCAIDRFPELSKLNSLLARSVALTVNSDPLITFVGDALIDLPISSSWV